MSSNGTNAASSARILGDKLQVTHDWLRRVNTTGVFLHPTTENFDFERPSLSQVVKIPVTGLNYH